MYIKLPMYQFCYMSLGYAGKPLLGPLEGVGPESQLFWAQMALALLVANSGPKKVLIFRAHPFHWPLKWIFLHQKHYVLGHISNRFINSYWGHLKPKHLCWRGLAIL